MGCGDASGVDGVTHGCIMVVNALFLAACLLELRGETVVRTLASKSGDREVGTDTVLERRCLLGALVGTGEPGRWVSDSELEVHELFQSEAGEVSVPLTNLLENVLVLGVGIDPERALFNWSDWSCRFSKVILVEVVIRFSRAVHGRDRCHGVNTRG